MHAIVVTSIIMVNTVNFNIHYCYGEQKTILSELVLIIIMAFPRILILVPNILIYLLEILNTILQGWRHCILHCENVRVILSLS